MFRDNVFVVRQYASLLCALSFRPKLLCSVPTLAVAPGRLTLVDRPMVRWCGVVWAVCRHCRLAAIHRHTRCGCVSPVQRRLCGREVRFVRPSCSVVAVATLPRRPVALQYLVFWPVALFCTPFPFRRLPALHTSRCWSLKWLSFSCGVEQWSS